MRFSTFLLVFICALCRANCVAQDTIFFNRKWQPVTDRSEATYYRPPMTQEGGKWRLVDYFATGQPQMTALLESPDMVVQKGHFIYYDSLGNKMREGDKAKGMRTGPWTIYRKGSGVRYSEVDYAHDAPNGRSVYFDSASQMIIAEGNLKENIRVGEWKYYYQASPKVRLIVPFAEGTEHGTVTQYFPTGQIKRQLFFEHGKFVKASQFNEQGEKVKYIRMIQSPREDIRFAVQKIGDLLAKRKLVNFHGNGIFYYRYYLTKEGALQALEDPKDPVAAAVSDALQSTGRWRPVKYEGEPVAAFVTARITFGDGTRLRFQVNPDVPVPLATDIEEIE